MNTRISIPSFLALVSVLLIIEGCKIEITVPKGGKVVSASHAYDCGSGKTCPVEVNDFHFDEKFDAHAWEGWVFVGWKSGWGYLCQGSVSVCQLHSKGLEQYEAIAAIVKSDEMFYLEPEFVKGTPFDEALANVQDESLRACLNKVPPPRRYAEQLRNVECNEYHYKTASVQGIEAFSSIKHLALRGNGSLTDLQPLGKLSRLQNLDLRLESPYFNAAALGELKLLDNITLWFDAPNPDLTEMGNLQSLRELRLVALSASNLDLNGIDSLVNLRELSLSYNRIADLGPLAGLTNLKYLDLDYIYISDIGPLAGLTNLETLYLGRNQISDIDSLAGLTNLETLYLDNNQIDEIRAPLDGLIDLKYLDLSSNQINDISGLPELKNLETLDLSNNEITDIGPLAEIDSIPRLYLQNNLIHDVSPLKQHYPLTLDPSFGPGIDPSYYLGFVLGSIPAPFGVSLDLSNNPIISIGAALDGIRAGGIFLIDVPLKCKEYPRLLERYDSRAIITHRVFSGFAFFYSYKLPERCI